MRHDDRDPSVLAATGRIVGSALAMALVWLVELICNMVASHRRESWEWPMRSLRERLSTRIAVDFIIVRSKVDLWLARRIRRKG
ncbi:MAG: hypothetical protein KGR26_07300 [Cyanobacteria bacterium REEB65]|nr:hypothetical protein [Cyanobacteria bacterium REEB65]